MDYMRKTEKNRREKLRRDIFEKQTRKALEIKVLFWGIFRLILVHFDI